MQAARLRDLETTRNLTDMALTRTNLHAVEIGAQGFSIEGPGRLETSFSSSGNVSYPCMATEVTSSRDTDENDLSVIAPSLVEPKLPALLYELWQMPFESFTASSLDDIVF